MVPIFGGSNPSTPSTYLYNLNNIFIKQQYRTILQEEIYQLSLELLQSPSYFQHLVHNTKVNYYWSDEWDEELYVKLAQLGFISTSYDTLDGLVLLPELQFEYAVLDFEHLHIGTKVRKLLRDKQYSLSFDTHFDEILQKIAQHHTRDNWLKGEYAMLMNRLFKAQHENFSLHTVALLSSDNAALVAGEIGYVIGKTYTSLSGFSSREKRYNNCGKLQLVLLAHQLERQGFDFWNLGHPHMAYKKNLGAQILTRNEFLQRWEHATDTKKKDLYE